MFWCYILLATKNIIDPRTMIDPASLTDISPLDFKKMEAAILAWGGRKVPKNILQCLALIETRMIARGHDQGMP